MATKANNNTEYGFVVGNISAFASDGTVTKAQFLAELERQYPYTDGWRVVSRMTNALTGNIFTVAYHLEKAVA
mgnify:CR=1 FL=1